MDELDELERINSVIPLDELDELINIKSAPLLDELFAQRSGQMGQRLVSPQAPLVKRAGDIRADALAAGAAAAVDSGGTHEEAAAAAAE